MLYKNKTSWEAESKILVDENFEICSELPKYSIKVFTKRYGSELRTILTVARIEGDFEVHELYRDLFQILARSAPARATEKVVEAQHMGFPVAGLLGVVKAFYKASVEPVV